MRSKGSGVRWFSAMPSFPSMPKPALRIGVLTLSRGDERDLDAGPLADQVRALIRTGTLSYTAAPDDWVPFNDGTTILRHLTDGLDAFEVLSNSVGIADLKARREIKLFVIDPAVLLHPAKARLAVLIQEHICSRNDKASCIVICRTLPAHLFDELFRHYSDKLRDLIECDGALFEYSADAPLRLKQFLKRVTPLLGDVPDTARRAEAVRILETVIGGLVPAIATPVIGIGAGK
jgi:hypothetical protein